MRRSALWLSTALVAGLQLIGSEPSSALERQPASIASYFAEAEISQPDGNPGESPLEAPGSTQAGEETDVSSAPPSAPAAGTAKPKKKPDLKKAAAGAYKDPFYNNDFSYLNNPAYNGYLLGEELKQLHPSCCTTLDIGGQYRARFHREQNMRGL